MREVSPLKDQRALRQLRSLISRERYDVVHTHQSKAGVLGRLAARGRSRRMVHTIHMASFGPSYGRIGSATFKQAERFCAQFTDVIVSVGQELRECTSLPASASRISTWPFDRRSTSNVSRRFALTTAEERARARTSFGLPSGSVIVTAAALEPRKRIGLIIEALASDLRSGSMVLAIAGDGGERSSLERQAEHAGLASPSASWDMSTDMPGLLSTAGVLVHAATVEGVPQVVIQALAAGVPAVATEMIGVRGGSTVWRNHRRRGRHRRRSRAESWEPSGGSPIGRPGRMDHRRRRSWLRGLHERLGSRRRRRERFMISTSRESHPTRRASVGRGALRRGTAFQRLPGVAGAPRRPWSGQRSRHSSPRHRCGDRAPLALQFAAEGARVTALDRCQWHWDYADPECG